MIPGEAILAAEDKLEAVRRLDPRWCSLQDWVCCTRCGRIFKVDEIVVLGGSRVFGPLRLHCPNEDCLATPADWTKCNDVAGKLNPGVASSRNGDVYFVTNKRAVGEPDRNSLGVMPALRRLNADWTALCRKLSLRIVRTAHERVV